MEYPVKKIETDDSSIKQLSKFLSEAFPKTDRFTPDFLKWEYADNPLGQITGFNAWDGDKIISHFAALRLNMNLFGKKCKGLLCINVSTDLRYRNAKLFKKTGLATVEWASENGFDFMIGVPNANSTHAFLKHFGFYLISPLTVKVGVGKNIYPASNHNCYKTWDAAQWEWRLKRPDGMYACDTQNTIYTPIAPFVKSISKKTVMAKDNNIQKLGFRPVNLYIGLGADTRKGFYLNIPSFIKRPPFNLVFKDLTGQLPVVSKEDIFLQLIDIDTI